MSVGLQVVRLLYGLYVFGHLSKWFTFLFLVLVSLSGCVVRYTCSQLVYPGTFSSCWCTVFPETG